MSCDCYFSSLLFEGRSTVTGARSGCGNAQSCAGQDDDSHPLYVNTKLTQTYAGGYTKVTDYSTSISNNGGASCPATTVTWTPHTPASPGSPLTSTWSVPLYLSDVRTSARGALNWNSWGTPPPFGGWTDADPEPTQPPGYNYYRAYIDSGALINYQQDTDLTSIFSPGYAYDNCNPGHAGSQESATVQHQQVRLTLGIPYLPIKVTWDIVKVSDSSVVSSGSVLLTPTSPTYTFDITPGTPTGTDNLSVQLANLHVFACPYHLS